VAPVRPPKRLLIGVVAFLVMAALLFLFRSSYQQWYQLWRWKSLDVAQPGQIPRKLWVFNVSDMQRFEKVDPGFTGIETNIVVDAVGKAVWLGETPGKTDGTALTELLAAAAQRKQEVLLDVHTEGRGYDEVLLNYLNNAQDSNGYRDRLVMELYSPASANFFAAYGYRVAINIGGKLTEQTPDSINRFKAGLHKNIGYVCEEAHHYNDFKNHFPEYRVITWAVGKEYLFGMNKLQALNADQQISAIVVDLKTSPF